MASWRPPELPGGVGRSRYHSLDVELQLQHQQEQQMQQYRQIQEHLEGIQNGHQQERGRGDQQQGQAPKPEGASSRDQAPDFAVASAVVPQAATNTAERLETQPLLRSGPGLAVPGSSSNSGAAGVPVRIQPRHAAPAPPAAAAAALEGGSGNQQLRDSPAGPGYTGQQVQQQQQQHWEVQMSSGAAPSGRYGTATASEPWSPSDSREPEPNPCSEDRTPGNSNTPAPAAPGDTGRGPSRTDAGNPRPRPPPRLTPPNSRRFVVAIAIMAVMTFLSIIVFFSVALAVWGRRAAQLSPGSGTDPRVAGLLLRANLSVRDMQLLRPGFHIRPPGGGWINDPNGLMQYRNMVHVFFQYNPYEAVWGPMHWGHVASPDLVHWVHLPIALAPSDPWDSDGCWSGSALVTTEDGVPRLYYTGVTNRSQDGFFYQAQATALPADPADPFLTRWLKPPDLNPLGLDLPPGGVRAQFRDPIAPWAVPPNQLGADMKAWLGWQRVGNSAGSSNGTNNGSSGGGGGGSSGGAYSGGNSTSDGGGGLWFTALGALDDCVGTAALYSSTDLRSWTYAGTLFSQLGQNFSMYEQCLSANATGLPPGARGYGGPCDQIGPKCRMWECPGFLTLDAAAVESSIAQVAAEAAARVGAVPPDSGGGGGGGGSADALGGEMGVVVFKYSDMMRNRTLFAADWYQLGSPSLLNYSLAAYQDGLDVFAPRLLLPPLPPLHPPRQGPSGPGGRGGGSGGPSPPPRRVLDSPPQLLDYGTVYASQSFRMDDGRVVWLGWVYEDSQGCSEVCAQGNELTRAVGWQGMLTFPRTMTYDADLHQLILRPVQELQRLRSAMPLYTGAGRVLLEVGTLPPEGDEETEVAAAGSRSCCRPSEEACRNGTLAAQGAGGGSGPVGGISEVTSNWSTSSSPNRSSSSCADSACWTLLPEEPKPEVYGNDDVDNVAADASSTDVGGEYGSRTAAGGATSAADSTLDANRTLRSQVSEALRRQMEVQLNFTIQLLYLPPPPPAVTSESMSAGGNTSDQQLLSPPDWLPVDFEVGMRLLTGNGSYVSIFINGTVPPPLPQQQHTPGAEVSAGVVPTLLQEYGAATDADDSGAGGGGIGGLYVDRSCGGGMTNGTVVQGGWLPLWISVEGFTPSGPSLLSQSPPWASHDEPVSATTPDGWPLPKPEVAGSSPPTMEPPTATASGGGGSGGGDSSNNNSGGGSTGGARSSGNTQQVTILGTSLQVLVDHSVLEAYGGGGRARITSRFYPAGDDVAWGVQAYARTWLHQPPSAYVPAEAKAAAMGEALAPGSQLDLGQRQWQWQEQRQRALVGFEGTMYRLQDGV